LAPRLPIEQQHQAWAEALAAADQITDSVSHGIAQLTRARALAALALHLPIEQQHQGWAEALAAARNITGEADRAEVLVAMGPLVSALPPSSVSLRWQESLSVLARRPRHELLVDLRALAPLLSGAGGEQAVAAAVQAIIDVGRWW
jgi:hypothetical protein